MYLVTTYLDEKKIFLTIERRISHGINLRIGGYDKK